MCSPLIDLDKTSNYCIKIPKLVLKSSLLDAEILLYTLESCFYLFFISGETCLPPRKLIIIISIHGLSIAQTFLDWVDHQRGNGKLVFK